MQNNSNSLTYSQAFFDQVDGLSNGRGVALPIALVFIINDPIICDDSFYCQPIRSRSLSLSLRAKKPCRSGAKRSPAALIKIWRKLIPSPICAIRSWTRLMLQRNRRIAEMGFGEWRQQTGKKLNSKGETGKWSLQQQRWHFPEQLLVRISGDCRILGWLGFIEGLLRKMQHWVYELYRNDDVKWTACKLQSSQQNWQIF